MQRSWLKRCPVACFQGTNGSETDLAVLRDELRAGIVFGDFIGGKCCWWDCHLYLVGAARVLSGSEGARRDRGQGIACLVRGRCGGPCDCERARAERCDYIFECKRYFRASERVLPPAAHCMSIILGDGNFVHMEDGSFLGDGSFGPGGRA
eukprot:8204331-Pyramimonas_sp.AAC.1